MVIMPMTVMRIMINIETVFSKCNRNRSQVEVNNDNAVFM